MASTSNAPTVSSQGKRSSISSYTGSNASLLLEKTKGGMRRSTPDSEALASSDDEQDQRHQHFSQMNQQAPKPIRRTSWLSEIQQASQRKGSLGGNYASVSSYPTTPATEPTSWPSTMGPTSGSTGGRGHSNSASFPWSSGIWNSDAQKGPPARLSEVLPSPTTVVPSGSSGIFGDAPLASPSVRRDSTADSAIPFAIPLHPTPKTYRSQSYSVGQLDPESTNGIPVPVQYAQAGRARAGSSYAGVQRRPSRPSMLSDFPHDASSVLEQLREVDDDEESATSSEAGVQLHNTQARTIEQLAMENAILRQAAAANQMQNMAASNPAFPSNGVSNMTGRLAGRTLQQRMSESVLEEPDEVSSGLDDLSIQHNYNYGSIGRRFSEVNANPASQFSITGIPENRKLESVKKGQWQSSLGFGGLADIPQSRRHSFADVPTRHGSISSAGDVQNGHVVDTRAVSGYNEGVVRQSQGDSGEYDHFRCSGSFEEQKLELEHLRGRKFAASYFSNADPTLRSPELYRNSDSPSSMHQNYGMQHQLARMPHINNVHGQLLYLVTFKACRAEFYYVQEGTGLQVKVGDLVIVEADRGTDLGTVAHENVDWAAAKEMKEQYAEEHYKWLMMFSRHGQNGSTPASNPNAATPSNGTHLGAIGGMGPPGQTSPADPSSVEIKPKMIKRLAQPHEIQTLRDKEGNEAKAKRMCQQKVIEHHLNMEILDAEFQMDWKKLTFYYFADSYINFNSLVTDLFKIYKTRIWMSAINPASFVTPPAGLQLPSGVGPGAVTLDRDGMPRSRPKRENMGFMPSTLSQAPQSSYEPVWNIPQEIPLPSAAMVPNAYSQFYQPQILQQMNPNLHDYGRGIQQVMRSPSPFGAQGYGAFNGIPQPTIFKPDAKNGTSRLPYGDPMNTWSNSFQSLSLGS